MPSFTREPSERTKARAEDNAGKSMIQVLFATGFMVAIAIGVALTLRVQSTIQAAACELTRISDFRQVGDKRQGECVRGRTQWDATATVYVTAWQQTRNATVAEQCRSDFDTWVLGSSYTCEYTVERNRMRANHVQGQ